ncbi:MAG: D-alanyl-D-alanine carboxypeptidase [Actinobacteria bacterium]|nr:D-alanyl-D-alanine carboxypeptidase [Actinomycetota bacterium]
MHRLHIGHRGVAGFAAAALVLVTGLGGLAGPARADTVGGEELASPHRTVRVLPGAKPLPEVWAQTWILADATTGEVLAQKGSHIRRAPASTLKMLTALAVLPNTSPEDTYVATAKAAYIYGSRVGLKPGRTYSLDQLWYAVFLPSANDAAIAVAQANGGVGKTIDEMNVIARDLQATDTVAKNTSGLDAPGQLSSAYDLALIARAGLAREDFSRYAGTARAEFPNVKGKRSHPIYTTNRLLLHGYEGMTGVKTGFTSRAGRTYVGAATREGTNLIVALMGIRESSESAARKLLDWGFANRGTITPIGELVTPISAGGDPVPQASPPTESTGADGSTPPAASAAAAVGDTRRAASPIVAESPARMSTAVLWGGALLAIAAAAASLMAMRGRRRAGAPRGRHSAASG